MGVFSPIKLAMDGLMNVISGLGTGSDKNSYGQYVVRVLPQTELESSYRSSPWSRKVHDIIPYEMTRAGRDWIGDAKQIDAIETEEERLKVWERLNQALVADRLFGGAGLVLGTNEPPEKPLDPSRIKKGGLRYVVPFNRYQLQPDRMDWNPSSDYFGGPEFFRLSSQGGNQVRFHASRVITFNSQPLPIGAQSNTQGEFWGDPLLTSLWNVLMNADNSQGNVAALLNEVKTDVLTVPEFGNNITTKEYEDRWSARLRVAALFQSQFNVKIIDGGDDGVGEKWETRQINFTNLPEVMAAFLQFVAGASDIPYTRLAGQSPGGMQSTGKGEQVDFEKAISSRQETNLKPQLNRLDEVLLRSAGVDPDNPDLYWKFAPLSQLGEKEQAEVEKLHAETVVAYSNSGLFDPDALAEAALNGIVERGVTLPGLEQAVREAGPVDREPDPIEPNPDDVPLIERQAPTDEAARPLYVRRDVLNWSEVKAWAEGQGFTDLVDDPHVTVLYSRKPVKWTSMGSGWGGDENGELEVKPGGPRVIEPLGDATAVLLFASDDLQWRHADMVRAGASHDYSDYQPHVTLSYGAVPDLAAVTPFAGRLLFGPEIFEPIKP